MTSYKNCEKVKRFVCDKGSASILLNEEKKRSELCTATPVNIGCKKRKSRNVMSKVGEAAPSSKVQSTYKCTSV